VRTLLLRTHGEIHMNSWRSKLFAILLGLAMFAIVAAPASAKSRHHHRHGRHGGHHGTHHKAATH
jgi:hypothetical protein